jgi:hypothetical protein
MKPFNYSASTSDLGSAVKMILNNKSRGAIEETVLVHFTTLSCF